MSMNPFDAPDASASNRKMPNMLAAAGAWLASLYWALLTLLIVFGTIAGTVSALQLVFPAFLIAAYAWRGLQVFQGHDDAAQSLLWLHALGAITAVMTLYGGGGVIYVLYGIKLAIHVFGGGAAWAVERGVGSGESMNPFQ